MRKTFKRIVTLLLVAMMALVVLTACGKRECDLCGKEAKTKVLKVEGEKKHLCEECYDLVEGMQNFAEGMQDFANMFG